MSLKTMHIVFLVASMALAAAFGRWAYAFYERSDSAAYLFAMVTAIAGGVGLFCYTIYFLRKIGAR